MDLHTLWQQAFPAVLPTPGEGGSSGLRAHARAKTVLILPSALGAL